MAAIRLNTAELDALHGLPFGAVTLYVLALRQRMDYARGTVGESPRVSWQALSEWCRQESRQGVPEERLNRWQLDRLIGHLERAGLVRRRPVRSPKDPLVFRLPLADRDSHVQKNPAHIQAPLPAPNPARAPHSGDEANPAHIPAPSPAPNPALHPAAGLLNQSSSSSTTIDDGQGRADDDDDDLVMPASLTPEQVRQARRKVAGLNGHRQTVLDELAGYLSQRHADGNPIRSPIGYLGTIVESARKPGWEPVHAPVVSAARERLRQAASSAPAPLEPRSAGKRADPDTARNALASIRSTIARKKPA